MHRYPPVEIDKSTTLVAELYDVIADLLNYENGWKYEYYTRYVRRYWKW